MSHLSQQHIVRAIYAADLALNEKKEDINRLNVFPVPDGDTGTNMALTIDTVIKELAALPEDASNADVYRAVTHGSLMGARGNSGVITSQILRGVCEGLQGADTFDAETIAFAANRSVSVAFNAVRKPVEGTILTVLKDCAEAATKAAEEGLSGLECMQAIAAEAMISVRRTPDLLPILKENNVVDAGGFGLAIMLEAFTATLTGDEAFIPSTDSLSRPEPLVAIEQVNDWEGSDYLYCTEFLFTAEELDERAALDFLESVGDCELLVGASPHYKIHVHTNEPGTVLSYMTERGQVADVHVHNMQAQSTERAQGLMGGALGAGSTGASGAVAPDAPPKEIGFIAVASGQGIARILESQDVDYVVSGGQTMNPSTKDFIDAIEAVNAKSIIIFPNNSNIILAANAAVANSSKPAAVVPTTSVPQSFSALFVANPDGTLEDNVAAMTEAIAAVKTAEVTTAVKKAKAANGSSIAKGDVIGITEKGIEVVGWDVSEVALELVEIITEDADVLTLLAGADFTDEQLEVLNRRIEDQWPDLETDCQRGDQPLYPLILAAE
ncbi:MAG: DAK2 domain-containing protein [Coriobacteriia bacterium]|nr:DAK2 domain-containing protein [Coriobacteriia bacterium]MCL2749402.1 DAK2 domain-containing protein [Coriobacteriia bacterium]